MLIKVFCVVSMLRKLPPVVCLGGGGGGAKGLLNKGGGSNRLPVEFPQVQTSIFMTECNTLDLSALLAVMHHLFHCLQVFMSDCRRLYLTSRTTLSNLTCSFWSCLLVKWKASGHYLLPLCP